MAAKSGIQQIWQCLLLGATKLQTQRKASMQAVSFPVFNTLAFLCRLFSLILPYSKCFTTHAILTTTQLVLTEREGEMGHNRPQGNSSGISLTYTNS